MTYRGGARRRTTRGQTRRGRSQRRAPGGPLAHQERVGVNGVAGGGRMVRRRSPGASPAARKTDSAAVIRALPGRFLRRGGFWKRGGADGRHGWARGGVERRRRRAGRGLGFRARARRESKGEGARGGEKIRERGGVVAALSPPRGGERRRESLRGSTAGVATGSSLPGCR
jgi:hypothetical protein